MSNAQFIPVIYDGDMGGDDIWAILMMYGALDKFDVLGITTVFGNVDGQKAADNILTVLSCFGLTSTPVYQGASRPLVGSCMFGDNAFGADGIGGVTLPRNHPVKLEQQSAHDYLVSTLRASDVPVTIIATGPLTNIAHLVQRAPDALSKIARVVVMGGALRPGPHPNPPERIGNITMAAEFNFFQDPFAANVVFNSGLRVDIVTMDATQCFYLDDKMQARINALTHENLGSYLSAFLAPALELDRPKFGVPAPFIHDPHVITFVLYPELYSGAAAKVWTDEVVGDGVDYMHSIHGQMHADYTATSSPIFVVNKITAPDVVQDKMVRLLEKFSQRT